jgi:Lysine methyltransferase
LLFSQSIPSQNLGFIDPKASALEITVGNHEFTIHQSPTILSSNRDGGTTGAGMTITASLHLLRGRESTNFALVVWKITPLFASWITSPENLLFRYNVLSSATSILELGSGVSGIIGLALGPYIQQYTLTDQEYVMKYLSQNLLENASGLNSPVIKNRKSKSKSMIPLAIDRMKSNIIAKPLDWETDEVSALVSRDSRKSFDILLACDCIYNEALISPLVQTCVDACQLRRVQSEHLEAEPTLCIIAQQLRSAEIFEEWLKAFHKAFRVWRVPDADLTPELKSNSGFVIHLGILR